MRGSCRNLPVRVTSARNFASSNAGCHWAAPFPKSRLFRSAIPKSMPSVSYALSDFYRGQHDDSELSAAVETTVSRAPASRWAEARCFWRGTPTGSSSIATGPPASTSGWPTSFRHRPTPRRRSGEWRGLPRSSANPGRRRCSRITFSDTSLSHLLLTPSTGSDVLRRRREQFH